MFPEELHIERAKQRSALLPSGESKPRRSKQEKSDLLAMRQLERAVVPLVRCDSQCCAESQGTQESVGRKRVEERGVPR